MNLEQQNTNKLSKTVRKNWIDYMKVFGMILIIWGHFFPPALSTFIYSFNVPLFFIISGYLTKREASFSIFWNKCLHNLIIPYLLLSTLKALGFIIKNTLNGEFIWSIVGILTGFHSIGDAPGNKNLWFVFTLILIKIGFQLYQNAKKNSLILIAIISIIATFLYNKYPLDISWSLINTLPAIPFFVLGNMLSSYHKSFFDNIHNKLKTTSKLTVLSLSIGLLICTYLLSTLNNTAWMYKAQYGNNIILFYILGIIGSFSIYLLSTIFDNRPSKICRIVAVGSIIILTFHRELNHPLQKLIDTLAIVKSPLLDFTTLLASIIVLISFVPIILFVQRYLPIFIGKRLIKH